MTNNTRKDSFVLSIWWGYCSGAALARICSHDNSICLLGAVSEERFTRVKNTSAFPHRSIQWLTSIKQSYSDSHYSAVVYTGNDVGVEYILMDKARWSVSDYIYENNAYWIPVLLDSQSLDYLEVMSKYIIPDSYPGPSYWNIDSSSSPSGSLEKLNRRFTSDLPSIISNAVGTQLDVIKRVNHHLSHASYAASVIAHGSGSYIIFSADGWGDGENATAWIYNSDPTSAPRLRKVFSSKTCIIARVYRYITLLLGMKPSEHEFKVMGLAPYSSDKYSEASYQIFRKSCWFEEGQFVVDEEMKDSYLYFKERLEGERFDNIAAGLQRWTQDLLAQWVQDVIRQHSIHNIAFSGGVALNVKAMQYLSALNIVHSIVVPPSASDESHIIGSIAAHVLCNSNELTFDKSFSCIPYYGPRPATSVLPDITEERCCGTRYEHVSFSRDTITHLAELAASGKILSTCRGNSEFGARALGNRSLLISPNNIQLREKLNTAIKSRDFWMPFAPVILVDYAHLYIELPDIRKINNRFMTQTYKLTPLGSELLQSASHQGDLTARAQIITRDDNSFLYSLIYEYGRITGTYGFLNTSFNTHGSPIVNTLDDALDIFFSTDIDILIADSFYLKKL